MSSKQALSTWHTWRKSLKARVAWCIPWTSRAFDTAHIVYGDRIFYDIYDDPGFIHHLLELAAWRYLPAWRSASKVIPGSDKWVAHYNSLVIPRSRGGIKISEDTSTLLSKSQIEEFVAPYMKKSLNISGRLHTLLRQKPTLVRNSYE